jgi:hypothetical protein
VKRSTRTRLAALGASALLACGLVAPAATSAEFIDASAAQIKVQGARWATNICVIWSNEARSDAVFTIDSPDLIAKRGWTTVLDARGATTVQQLKAMNCSVVMIAGEAWGVTPAARTLALAWFNQEHGGSVLSTGNDTGHANYPLPELIASIGAQAADYPYGGAVPASAAERARLSPAFPTWTPGAPSTYELDNASQPVTAVAAGAVGVGTVAGHPQWFAAVAKTNAQGGRWVHLHTKIGSPQQRGDAPLADAALAWLAIGRS